MRVAAAVLAPAFLLDVLGGATPASAQFPATIEEIGPKRSSLHPADPDGASGGRVNGLAVARTDRNLMYAASEYGGLYRSTDAGRIWRHVPGHVPVVTWDVEIDPTDARRVYATSFYDGRVQSRAGINVSTDGGTTWAKPATATPPANFCADPRTREQPAAFGIAISDADAADVYIGTSCGLAVSNDRGGTWRFVDPTPGDRARSVWDVVVHHGGVIDVCGDDGHARSADGGATWTSSGRLPNGICSIAASPTEAHVLFAVVGTTIFESTDGGGTWASNYANPQPQGRIPFVATNRRAGGAYDLWFGDVQLHRRGCITPNPPTPGGAARCQPAAAWTGPFTRSAGGHDDMGAILFDPTVNADACPLLMSSDGGVYFNTRATSPGCHDPRWDQPNVTPQAVWNWAMAGASRGGTVPEDLYFGNQDTGGFGTTDAGATPPNWNNADCCDVFDVAAEPARVISTLCCFGGGRATRLFIRNPGMTGGGETNTYPPGNLVGFTALGTIANVGPGSYAVVTTEGVFLTDDITANPVQWRELGATSVPANACALRVAGSGAATTLFVKDGGCDGDRGGALWRHQGTAAGGNWQQITRAGAGLFGVFAVDRNDPGRIIASDLGGASGPAMVMSTDGGATWTALTQLDALMTGNGAFLYQNDLGPRRFTSFGGYPQPTLVAFDARDRDVIAAAAADSGVFLSLNAGTSWTRVTDPHNPAASGRPHIPRARYAYFEHDEPGRIRLYLGTQGRGQWRISFAEPTAEPPRAEGPAIAAAGTGEAAPLPAEGGPSAEGGQRAGVIEIVLPGGRLVRVDRAVDAGALRRVLAVLDGR
jgi:hypothetical protein